MKKHYSKKKQKNWNENNESIQDFTVVPENHEMEDK